MSKTYMMVLVDRKFLIHVALIVAALVGMKWSYDIGHQRGANFIIQQIQAAESK